jgi:hypothetical protein
MERYMRETQTHTRTHTYTHTIVKRKKEGWGDVPCLPKPWAKAGAETVSKKECLGGG